MTAPIAVSTISTRHTRQPSRWRTFLIAYAVVTGILFLLPRGSAAQGAVYNGLVVFAGLGLWRGSQRAYPADRRAWRYLLTYVVFSAIAESIWWVWEIAGIERWEHLADGFFLTSYGFLVAGVIRLVHRVSPARDRSVVVDTAIASVSAGAVIWVFLLAPVASDSSIALFDKFLTLAYPAMDVAVIAGVVRLLLASRGRSTPHRMMLASLVALVVADLAFASIELAGGYGGGGWLDLFWEAGYGLLAVAALHPSSRQHTGHPTGPRVDLARILLVFASSAMLPITILFVAANSMAAGTLVIVGVAQLAVLVLVGARFLGLVRISSSLAAERGEARLAALVNHAADVIIVTDDRGVIGYASPSARSTFGLEDVQLEGSFIDLLIEPDHVDAVRQAIASAGRTSGVVQFDAAFLRNGTEPARCSCSVVDLRGEPAVGGFVITIRDVHDRWQLEQQLRRRALHDPLTGLANRTLFLDRLGHALARRSAVRGSDIAVCFIDLDDFKAVNDGLGHGIGDELLCSVAQRLSACVRSGDTVARFGGDEFAVLFEDVTDMASIDGLCARLLDVLALPLRAGTLDLAVQASVGLVVADVGHDAASLLRDADIAMYEAKLRGKGRIERFDSSLRVRAERHLELRSDLVAAIERNEFEVLYQPIVTLPAQLTVGAEALLRWHHPKLGPIPPTEFIPVAEQIGVINAIGRWVLHQACSEATRWPDDTYVSVNVSAVQLRDDTFPMVVADVLTATGLPANRLMLELTESALVDDSVGVAGKLSVLRGIGVSIAIDDFGTGYNSLTMIRQFPIDVVKIDRSFTAELGGGSGGTVAATIVYLAGKLGVRCIAEGVESERQAVTLGDIGCGYGQGYRFARPLTAPVMRARLAPDATFAWPPPDATAAKHAH